MLKHICLVFTMVLPFIFVSQCKAATKGEIARVNWNKKSVAELEGLLPDLKAVQQFAVEVMTGEADVDNEDLSINTPEVVDYEFVDLKGNGGVELVCLLDYTGRARPTQLMAVENNQGQLETAYLQAGAGGLGIGELREVIRDMKRNGRNEVLVSYALEPFEGAVVPTPHLEHVYSYQNGKFVQSDREFLDYYENVLLPTLRQELKRLAQQSPLPGSRPRQRELYQKAINAKQKEIDALTKMLTNP